MSERQTRPTHGAIVLPMRALAGTVFGISNWIAVLSVAAPPMPQPPPSGRDAARVAVTQNSPDQRSAAAARSLPLNSTWRPAVFYTFAAQPTLEVQPSEQRTSSPDEPSATPPQQTPAERGKVSAPAQDSVPSTAPPFAEKSRKITIAFGESYKLSIPAEIGKLTSWIVADEGVALVQPIELPGTEGQGPAYLLVGGRRMDSTELSLTGETGTAQYTIEVIPSITYLEALLLRQFPNSNLRLTQAAKGILVVDGHVDSAAEVAPIVDLLEKFAPGGIINGLRITGPVQVQLEVVFARVDRTRLRQLGFNFTGSENPWYFGSQAGSVILAPQITAPAGAIIPGIGGPSSAPMTPNATLFLGITRQSSGIHAYLQALEEQGVAKVLARPTLVTLSGRPATFLDGGEQPYATVAGVSQNPSYLFKSFGTELTFLPVVMGQGRIRLDVRPSVTRIDEATAESDAPRLIKQSYSASVEMESSQTLVLAGMYQTSSDAQVQKVPVLGSLPGLGVAFRRVRHVAREEELTVLVTPSFVHPMDPHQTPPILPGEETRNPADCELYLDGLPEVDTAIGSAHVFFGSRRTGQSESAPVQYPTRESALPSENSLLPEPRPSGSDETLSHSHRRATP